jgi:hypothetical protein
VTTRRSSGQASTEYVSVLLVVGLFLMLAATAAVAVPGVGERVVATVRTGICIVGGDVCRPADAAAAGLDPCVTGERSRRHDTTLDIAVVRLGGGGEWQLALQSDGAATVSHLSQSEAGGTVGVGLTFSPAGLEAGGNAALTARFRSGRAWRFPDAASAAAFLEGAQRNSLEPWAREPDVRWDGLGAGGEADLSAALAGLATAGISATAEGAVGLRREGARRTLTVDLGTHGPAIDIDLPGFPGGPGAGTAMLAEVTWEHGRALALALRTAQATEGRLEETTARVDLRDPVHRALAERLLRPGDSREAVRALARRAASHGVVERAGYTTTERRRGINVAGRLGVALGLSHERVTAERRLVDAIASVRGGPAQRRFDCLGV